MQYLRSTRSLPFHSLFARNFLVVAAAAVASPIAFANGISSNSSSDCNNNNNMSNAASESSSYAAGSNSVAFVTTPDKESAKKLARGLVERKLAACVNIIPQIESIYMWEGKINEDSEYLMMIKTRTTRVEELSKYVRENHPYSVAEVITLPIQGGNSPYLKWIKDTVPEKSENKD